MIYSYVNGIVFDNDRVYVVNNADNNKYEEDEDILLSYDARLVGNVSAYNVNATAKLWEYEKDSGLTKVQHCEGRGFRYNGCCRICRPYNLKQNNR